jgi:hypothetical protein
MHALLLSMDEYIYCDASVYQLMKSLGNVTTTGAVIRTHKMVIWAEAG